MKFQISLTKQLQCRIKLFYQYSAQIHVVCTFTWCGLLLFAIKCREWVLEWLRLLILSKALTSQTWIRISLSTLNVNVSRFQIPTMPWLVASPVCSVKLFMLSFSNTRNVDIEFNAHHVVQSGITVTIYMLIVK